MIDRAIAAYRKMHSTDELTWIAHAGQAFLIMAVTYGFMALMPGDYSHNLRMGVGTYGAFLVFGHRELSDIIPAWVKAREADPGDHAAAQKHLSDKLRDGFFDFWSVPVGIALFALISSLIGG